MTTEQNVENTYSIKTNLLQARNWKSATHDELTRKYKDMITIEKNESKLWKRYVAKQYKDGELIASYPADKLCEIDLTYFVK